MINVRNAFCTHKNCSTRVYYGKPGHFPSHCAKHRQPGMITRPNAKCSQCKSPAIWGTNWVPARCDDHKQPDDQNLVEKECAMCGLTMLLDDNGVCEYCNPVTFQRARLAKQTALMDYLDARELTGTSTDTTIDRGACGRERPDRVYELADKILIIECDEHQHRDRACDCEQTRMINIGQSYGGMPVYFIRWNPDNYCSDNDRKQPEEIKKRHKLVGDLIASIAKGKTALPRGLVNVLYMYYNGWSTLAKEKWTVLLEYSTEIDMHG